MLPKKFRIGIEFHVKKLHIVWNLILPIKLNNGNELNMP